MRQFAVMLRALRPATATVLAVVAVTQWQWWLPWRWQQTTTVVGAAVMAVVVAVLVAVVVAAVMAVAMAVVVACGNGSC